MRLTVSPGSLVTIADRIDSLSSTLSVPGLRRCLDDLSAAWSGEAAGRALARLSALIDRAATCELRLLKFSRTPDRLIVAFGDPVTSPCIATYIPGAGTCVATAGDELSRAAALRAAAGPGTCVIMWLGYDAPSLIQAVSPAAAVAAAPALRAFQAGLVSDHDGPIRQLTVIGHSYGSVVIGIAERDGDLAADDLVALGSPGMGVRHLSQLRPETQIWHSMASNDPVRLVPGHLRGGTPFASAPFGHGGYFHPANPALTTLAALASATCPAV